MNRAQQMMVEDGLPAEAILTQEQREVIWASKPQSSATRSFKDDDRKELRAKLKREETEVRIKKMLAGQARKAAKNVDTRGKRWDARQNKWVDQ